MTSSPWVNADVVNKLVNLASRTAGFISKRFDGQLAATNTEPTLYSEFVAARHIAEAYEARRFSRAIRDIMALANIANRYVDEKAPWVITKQEGREVELQEVCTVSLNLFRVLMTYLQPVLPQLAERSAAFLQTSLSWKFGIDAPLLAHSIAPFKALFSRIDRRRSKRWSSASRKIWLPRPARPRAASPSTKAHRGKDTTEIEPIAPEIAYDDFAKLDLRIARIVNAELVADADKLLKLQLDIGVKPVRCLPVFAPPTIRRRWWVN